jgi:hypothetical protein
MLKTEIINILASVVYTPYTQEHNRFKKQLQKETKKSLLIDLKTLKRED